MAGLVAAAVLASACSFADEQRDAPKLSLLHERAGALAGVRMGASEADVRRVFGEPGGDGGFTPLNTSYGEIGGAPVRNWPLDWRGRPRVLRYRDVAFLLGPDGVFAFVVTAEGARTRAGVGIGDRIARARKTYGVGCVEQPWGEIRGGGTHSFLLCRTTIANRFRLWFGRDPIRSITLARVGR